MHFIVSMKNLFYKNMTNLGEFIYFISVIKIEIWWKAFFMEDNKVYLHSSTLQYCNKQNTVILSNYKSQKSDKFQSPKHFDVLTPVSFYDIRKIPFCLRVLSFHLFFCSIQYEGVTFFRRWNLLRHYRIYQFLVLQ